MIPKNPLTLLINGALVDAALKTLGASFLPGYDIDVTSAYRSLVKQEELKRKGYKPAPDSAHLYNLARDFVLRNKETGKIVPDSHLKKLYEEFIKPNWEGYTYFSPKQPWTSTGWVHVNLDRSITDHVKYIAYAGTAAAAWLGAKEVFKLIQEKLKK